jgi:hypothetical protein
MSRPIINNMRFLNLYCGFILNEKERLIITELALDEMNIFPIHHRRKPFELVKEAKRLAKYRKWVTLKERYKI